MKTLMNFLFVSSSTSSSRRKVWLVLSAPSVHRISYSSMHHSRNVSVIKSDCLWFKNINNSGISMRSGLHITCVYIMYTTQGVAPSYNCFNGGANTGGGGGGSFSLVFIASSSFVFYEVNKMLCNGADIYPLLLKHALFLFSFFYQACSSLLCSQPNSFISAPSFRNHHSLASFYRWRRRLLLCSLQWYASSLFPCITLDSQPRLNFYSS